MPWRLRYKAWAEWYPAGTGQLTGSISPLPQIAGPAQTFQMDNATGGQIVFGSGSSNNLNATDVTTLTNAMASDISTQMNNNLTRINGFATGSG